MKVGRYALYEPDREERGAFCVVDEKTLLVGPGKTLKAVLERDKLPAFSPSLQGGLDALRQLPAESEFTTVSAVLDLKALRADRPNPLPKLWTFDLNAVFGTAERVVFCNDVSVSVLFAGMVVCEAGAAQKTTTALVRASGDLRKVLLSDYGFPTESANQLFTMSVTPRGNTVQVRLPSDPVQVVNALKAIFR